MVVGVSFPVEINLVVSGVYLNRETMSEGKTIHTYLYLNIP